MATKQRPPKTLIQAVRYFKDTQTCIDFLAAIRWPDGVTCPTCGNEKVGYLANQQRWQCSKKHPKRQFSVKVGTIFEDSPIGLDKWLPAMWLIVSCKNGISSYELGRAIGVTQTTGWFMLQRLRFAPQTTGWFMLQRPRLAPQRGWFDKIGGPTEADETFIGGLSRCDTAEAVKRKGNAASTELVPVEQFKEFVRRVVAVPKKEIDRRLADQRRRRRAAKRVRK